MLCKMLIHNLVEDRETDLGISNVGAAEEEQCVWNWMMGLESNFELLYPIAVTLTKLEIYRTTRTTPGVKNFIRCLFAVAFQVIIGYDEFKDSDHSIQLRSQYPALEDVYVYYENTWLRGNYNLEMWNVHGADSSRTVRRTILRVIIAMQMNTSGSTRTYDFFSLNYINDKKKKIGFKD